MVLQSWNRLACHKDRSAGEQPKQVLLWTIVTMCVCVRRSVRRGGYPTGGLASEHGYLPGSGNRPPREEADKRMGSGAPNKAGGTEMKEGTTT